MSASQLFDLNIEQVLDHWEIEHGIRELIANALDEQLLTSTADVEISEHSDGVCRIRDFGRGLTIEHFTLSENIEKLQAPEGVIGKFGVGLKDALATFYRRGVGVTIISAHGTFRLREAHKHNFEGITTLHVERSPGIDGMAGTEVLLDGVDHEDVAKAKALFLRFSDEQIIERTAYGEVLRKGPWNARVYISGVLASEEKNFLFSYNITSLTEGMKKRLNRERLDVGRTTYADRVKGILRSAQSETVTEALADQVAARARGNQCDEMQWIEVSQWALNLLHTRSEVTYLTEEEMRLHPDVVDNMRQDGYEVVAVDDAQKAKLERQVEEGDTELRTLEGYLEKYNDSFRYEFVEVEDLTPHERTVFNTTPMLLNLIGIEIDSSPTVLISETMRVGLDSTQGVWDSSLRAIVIKRGQLTSIENYGGTLLHEAAHATTNAVDATRFFESVLTKYLGLVAAAALAGDPSHKG
jgi:hypothetical protein